MSSVGTSYLRSSGAGESIVEESAATDAEAETVELDAEGKQVGPGKQRWTPQEGEGEEEEAMVWLTDIGEWVWVEVKARV